MAEGNEAVQPTARGRTLGELPQGRALLLQWRDSSETSQRALKKEGTYFRRRVKEIIAHFLKAVISALLSAKKN